ILRLGGIAILLTLIIVGTFCLDVSLQFIGLFSAMLVIFVMGLMDDVFGLPVWFKFIAQITAIIIAIAFGIHIGQITNPFGGIIILPVFWDYLLSGFWLLLLINTMNFIDGADGLAGGITLITSLTLVALSLTVLVNQPQVAMAALIVAGTMVGFLVWNWHPAKIFMGDSGSNMLGLILGSLAMIGGAKLATTALVLGFPILDVFWSAIRRWRSGLSPFAPDRLHLHHRLLSLGVPHSQTVLLILGISAVFGLIALMSGTWVKIITMALAGLLLVLLFRTIFLIQRKKRG
ncbi:MAG: MraY family glycosyltransferase, partial [Patescibacteria group bacterium]|nr:MraY family glycosyltransferase [Patescibacteria group bacterium]